MLRQLARLRIYKVNFTGGEPLIRRDAVELMRFARPSRHPAHPSQHERDPAHPAKLDEVLAAGVRSFNISVDGPGALHDRIRGRQGAFIRTIGHLRNVIAAAGPVWPEDADELHRDARQRVGAARDRRSRPDRCASASISTWPPTRHFCFATGGKRSGTRPGGRAAPWRWRNSSKSPAKTRAGCRAIPTCATFRAISTTSCSAGFPARNCSSS